MAIKSDTAAAATAWVPLEVCIVSKEKDEGGQLHYSFKPSVLNKIPAAYVPENSLWYPTSHQGWDSCACIFIKKSVGA